MAVDKFQNFDIRIRRESPEAGRTYIAEAEGISESFAYPFSKDQERNIELETRANSSSSRRATDPARYERARAIGFELMQCALKGRLLEAWNVRRARAEKQDFGLRLRLRCPGAPEIMDLPWEYAWYPPAKFHLAMYESTPVVRCVDLEGEARKAVRVDRRLRILVILSSPRGLPRLKGMNEWKKMAEKFAAGREVELTLISRPASLERVIGELANREYHVLHFIGHGQFNEGMGTGELIFEDDKRNSEPVDSIRTGQIVKNHPSLRLAVLNSCEGGRASVKDLFGGVAQQLLQAGLPAAIGMQYEIPDSAAIRFSESFYQRIAGGRSHEAALTYARLQMAAADGMEWAIPVLYMHPDAEKLFVWPPPEPPGPPGPPEPVAPERENGAGVGTAEHYVRRIVDDRASRLFRAQGVSLVISAPGQFGRSTVLRQLEEQAAKLNKRPVALKICDFPNESFLGANEFFREFTRQIAARLNKKTAWAEIETRWLSEENNIVRCGELVQGLIDGLPGKNPVSFLIDDVDLLLGLPFREDFFKLLRVWHGQRREDAPWRRVDLVVATSEEPWSVDLDKFDQIALPPFTEEETAWLNRKLRARLSDAQVGTLHLLLGGHPKLTQRCLRAVADGETTAAEVTLTDRDPLAGALDFVDVQATRRNLLGALKEILASQRCSEDRAFCRLRGLGIVGRYRRPVKFTCPLYQDYFREALKAT